MYSPLFKSSSEIMPNSISGVKSPFFVLGDVDFSVVAVPSDV